MSRSDRPYHHGDLRESLLDAAFSLLDTTSPSEISLRGVAKSAGVSHAAPYHHFASRVALLEALGTVCMQRFVEEQEAASAAAASGREALLAQGIAYLGFAARLPHAFALVFDPAICDPAAPTPERAALISRNEDLLRANVASAQAEGLFPQAETPRVATGLWGTVHGLARLVIERHLTLEDGRAALTAIAMESP